MGGTSGLGFGVAKKFLENGVDVIVGGRDEAKLKMALGSLGQNSRGFKVDITLDKSVEDFFDNIDSIDYLVVTSSTKTTDIPLSETNIDDLKVFAETKLWGTLRCVKKAQKSISSGGSIVLVAGAASKKGRPGAHAKTIVNNALEGLARSLAAEFGAKIRINCISPSSFDSKETMTIDMKKELSKNYPVGYIGNSDDVASMIYAVATNRFMSGSTTYIDGGWTAV